MGSVAESRTKPSDGAVLEIITRGGVYKDLTSHPLAKTEAEAIADFGYPVGEQHIEPDAILAIRIGGKS